eukprot:4740251-Amphidinium_carterae.1
MLFNTTYVGSPRTLGNLCIHVAVTKEPQVTGSMQGVHNQIANLTNQAKLHKLIQPTCACSVLIPRWNLKQHGIVVHDALLCASPGATGVNKHASINGCEKERVSTLTASLASFGRSEPCHAVVASRVLLAAARQRFPPRSASVSV